MTCESLIDDMELKTDLILCTKSQTMEEIVESDMFLKRENKNIDWFPPKDAIIFLSSIAWLINVVLLFNAVVMA